MSERPFYLMTDTDGLNAQPVPNWQRQLMMCNDPANGEENPSDSMRIVSGIA